MSFWGMLSEQIQERLDKQNFTKRDYFILLSMVFTIKPFYTRNLYYDVTSTITLKLTAISVLV
jgi:hypothetical protein